MKKGYVWLVIALFACAVLPASALAQAQAGVLLPLTPPDQLVDAEGQVIFTDALVETAIRDALGAPEGPLTAKQLGKLGAKDEELQISAPTPVTLDLSVLQLCGKLRRLHLEQITPADNGAISALQNLQYLFIYEADISDFSFLTKCKKLTNIWIGSCPCGDISFVAQLPKLCNFHIDSRVADLSPLYASKKLVAVSIGQASDAEVNALLDQMGKRLTSLGLKSCPVTEMTLERIAKLKLDYLLIGGVPLSNIAPIWNLKSLQTLKLFHISVKSLEGIQNLKKLKVLELEDMEGTVDLTPVYTMPSMRQLHLDGVTLGTLSGIEGLQALTELTLLRVSGITDYSPLSGLTKLKVLYTDTPERMPEGLPVQ